MKWATAGFICKAGEMRNGTHEPSEAATPKSEQIEAVQSVPVN